MQDPVYNLKVIIDAAVDLYRAAVVPERSIVADELLEMGKSIKEKTERLIDMAWYKADPEEWNEQHPGNVGTSL